MNYKDLLNALVMIEDDRNIPKEVILDALKEALMKAYRKNVELPDIYLRVDINEKNGHISIFQQYKVVEVVEDDEMEISLTDARLENEEIQLDDFIERQVSLDNLSRASATLARNVMKQKIREAEKSAVYEEYADLLDEMVLGIVESVEDKFVLVNLGRTIAMMPGNARIPNERYYEGQKLRVVITDVKKDTKGSQVLVSRSDANLVKRLFEKEVPEIFQGLVEIKAIAREAGERTKMAVFSHNPDVDAIGACIGPRGNRVQEIIEELKGEKIDIFEWSDDITSLVKNALAPAEVIAVIPSENEKNLTIVVNNDQLSLAIGKKGKNARLAVKLTERKIDIKTKEELEEMGVNYEELLLEYRSRLEKKKKEEAARELEKMKQEAQEAEERRLASLKKLEEEQKAIEKEEPVVEEEILEEPIENSIEEVKEEVVEVEKPISKKKTPIAPKTEYVSVFEKLIGDNKPKQEGKDYKKKKKKDEDEHKLRSIDIRKDLEYEIKPEYSEEELEEIRRQEEEEEMSQYDDYMDYEDYNDYYDDDEI